VLLQAFYHIVCARMIATVTLLLQRTPLLPLTGQCRGGCYLACREGLMQKLMSQRPPPPPPGSTCDKHKGLTITTSGDDRICLGTS